MKQNKWMKSMILIISLIFIITGCRKNDVEKGSKEEEISSNNTVIQNAISSENKNRDNIDDLSGKGSSVSHPVDGNKKITIDEAKQIALNHAGISEKETTFIKEKIDFENGQEVYEIEFYSGNTEYDYDISTITGDIIKYDLDIDNYTIKYFPEMESNNDIGISRATSIALEKVPGADNNNIIIQKDYDNGLLIYEGKIIYNEVEYEFEIDAATGNVLDWDVESIYK